MSSTDDGSPRMPSGSYLSGNCQDADKGCHGAAIEVKEECGYDIVPEIMIPLVGEKKELKYVKDVVVEIAELVKKEKNSDIQYHIGTMIEIPRAALTADKVAEEADFFSFGTNDLTQMTFASHVTMPASSWIPTTRLRFTSLTHLQDWIRKVLDSWLRWLLRRDVPQRRT